MSFPHVSRLVSTDLTFIFHTEAFLQRYADFYQDEENSIFSLFRLIFKFFIIKMAPKIRTTILGPIEVSPSMDVINLRWIFAQDNENLLKFLAYHGRFIINLVV